jgi:3-methyladenine DNA glycosylase AlkD
MLSRAQKLEQELLKNKDAKKSKILSRYFKTGLGDYGEGDIFLGISVVDQRKITKDFLDLSFTDLQKFLNSKIHEFRFSALIILVKKYQLAGNSDKKKIVDFYLKNIKNINNWDLVDTSCYNILGDYLCFQDRKILYKLVASKDLWSRRIAIVSTFYFIKNNDLDDTFKISQILIKDKHDLIHKAVGWMLREAGKRDKKRLKTFLSDNREKISRITLRYAIEKFNEIERKRFLENNF